ncbi:MAG: VCBS repeat-containing protein [Planctomycetes bacterium]|nr:VCBS repeat-containing protein [Planctomycetota bacterium]
MTRYALPTRLALAALALVFALALGCEEYPSWLVGGSGTLVSSGGVTGGAGGTFTENLIQERTFLDGRAVVTTTYRINDMTRTPVYIDFDGDGQVDPVVGYQHDDRGIIRGVIQILLSRQASNLGDFLSLPLDGGGNPWANLLDVAVGDIDGDGALDIVAATRDGVVYLHHPTGRPVTDLRYWGNETAELELINGTTETVDSDELLAIVTQALGPFVNLDNYTITVEQGYTNVEIADFDNDGDNDVAASRRMTISLEPNPGVEVPPEQIVAGNVQILINPEFATDGQSWTAISIGGHERHSVSDRDGAAGVMPYDVDGDGDLDVISAARKDAAVQLAWFENPGTPLDSATNWTQWRIGSLRDAWTFDVADLTNDGRPDVVATGPETQQMVLFVQPTSGPQREYEWDRYAIVNFESYQPLDVKALDIDNDGSRELVVGGSEGAVRYFEQPANLNDEWGAHVILNCDPPGDVGLLGYGDVDGDGDFDFIAVLDSTENDNYDRVLWIRNDGL